MKWIAIVAGLALAGCSGFVGSPHGYIGDIEMPIGLTIKGVPSIVPDGAAPMGFRMNADGSIEDAYNTLKTDSVSATGMTAIVLACGSDPDCIRAALN